MIKKFLILILLASNIIKTKAVEIAIGAKKHEKMPLVVGVFGSDQAKIEQLVHQVIKDVEFSQQIKAERIMINTDSLQKDFLQGLAQKNRPLGLFFNVLSWQGSNIQFEWRLYDLFTLKMLAGKTVACNGQINQVAHLVANKLWQELMGTAGFFNSIIVACQKIKKNDKNYQYIYAFHATNGAAGKKLLIDTHTINMAPRWHPQRRLLYYSQHTPKNVRLMSVDEHGRKRIVTDFSGLNLTPAISPQGQIVVALSSGGCEKLYRYDYDPAHKVNKFTALTDCRMHAISPTFIDEEHVVFCAIEASSKLPRIAILNTEKRTATFLTDKSFCVSPAYCHLRHQIAYCKRINGVQQIFSYDLKTKSHAQLTTTSGDKDECNWSPCGNYLVFTEYGKKGSRIAVYSLVEQVVKYLTPAGENWSFPAWSPCYEENLFVAC